MTTVRTCVIEGCSAQVVARGWCSRCYQRWQRNGAPDVVYVVRDDPAARFWAKVRKGEGCWEWDGAVNPGGYGSFSLNGKTIGAHRAALLLSGFKIAPGMDVDHLCRNRRCVRLDHLEVVTPRENKLRGEGVGAKAAQRTVCPQGHPYDGVDVLGRRFCRRCAAQAKRRYRQRQKGRSS